MVLHISKEGYEPSLEDIKELMQIDMDGNNSKRHCETSYITEYSCLIEFGDNNKDQNKNKNKNKNI